VIAGSSVIVSCYTLFNDVYITSPVDGEYTTDSTVSIEIYTSGEIAGLEVSFNGVLLGGSTSYTVDVERNSANTVSVDGYDEIGNLVDYDSVTFYHDTLDPSLSVNMSSDGRTLTFSGAVTDNFVVEELTYEHHTYASIDGTIIPFSNSSWQLVLEEMPYSDEEQTMYFTAVDAAGNSTTVAYPYTLTDTTAPLLSINSPIGWQTYDGGGITLSATASDDYELGALWYSLDGDPLVEISPSAPGTFNTSVTVTAAGTHEIDFVVADSFFNLAQASVTFYIN